MGKIIEYKEIIEIFASIGTFLSALVATYTIFEIRKQRKSTYKPELFLDSFYFHFTINPFFDNQQMMRFFNFYFQESNKKKSGNINYIYVNYALVNLGFGFAKSINCEWDYDFKKAFNSVKAIAPDFITWGEVLSYINIESSTPEFHDTFNKNDIQTSIIDFIAPSSNQERERTFTFPHILIKLHVYYLIFKYKLYNESATNFYHEEFKELPTIKLKLSYKDLNNETYIKNLKIRLTASSLQIDDIINCKEDLASFSIDISE